MIVFALTNFPDTCIGSSGDEIRAMYNFFFTFVYNLCKWNKIFMCQAPVLCVALVHLTFQRVLLTNLYGFVLIKSAVYLSST